MQLPRQPQRQVKQPRKRRAAVPGRPRLESILQNLRIARADGIVGQAKRLGILCHVRLAAIDDIRSRFTAGIFQHLGDDERKTLREQQAQEAAVELPQSVLHSIWSGQLLLPRRGVPGFIVREQSVDEQRVDGNGN